MLPIPFRSWLAATVLAAAPLGLTRADTPKPVVKSEKELLAAAEALNSIGTKEEQDKKLQDLVAKGQRATTRAMVKAAVKVHLAAEAGKSPFKFNAAIILANAAYVTKEYAAAEPFYKFCAEQAEKLQSGPKVVQAYTGLIDLTWAQKKYEECERLCGKFLRDFQSGGKEVENAQFAVMEKQLYCLVKMGETDKALERVETLTQIDNIGWIFLEMKAQIQREIGKYKEAVETQKDLIDRIKDQDGLPKKDREGMVKQATYVLSALYIDADQVDKATDTLEKLVKQYPDNSTYKNDLGFIWCDHDKKLDESEKLIVEAMAIDKKEREKLLKEGKITESVAKEDNAAYLDSLGWVKFKKKEYAEAKKYLLRATQDEDDGNHMEIWDHLADCHMALGEVKEAVDVWTKSLKFDDVTKKDDERRKIVTKKLTKAKAQLKK
ncbi:MAG TPA: tetratricopeptide repeat protein [Fimbriiglobus sp.]|jgi:tetratricopeptide (TPR) repeat protein